MSHIGRPTSARRRWDPAQTVIMFALVAIVAVVLVAGVQRHYLSTGTAIFIVVFVPSVMLHEVSHGVVALWCGDDTAKQAGRLTLNPLKHVDPVGSLVVPALFVLAGKPPFGWAKPVPVNIGRLRHPRDQAVLVGLAGPATNIVLAAIGGLVFRVLIAGTPHEVINGNLYLAHSLSVGQEFALYFGIVNIILAAFNLIPIPPLDGSAVVERLLPASVLPQYYRMRMGFMLLVFFLVFFRPSALDSVFNFFFSLFYNLFAR